MENHILVFLFIGILFCFWLNLFGLMNIYPLYLTSPLLFLSILVFLWTLNNRNRFSGFK